jgi:hypothetical protein
MCWLVYTYLAGLLVLRIYVGIRVEPYPESTVALLKRAANFTRLLAAALNLSFFYHRVFLTNSRFLRISTGMVRCLTARHDLLTLQ